MSKQNWFPARMNDRVVWLRNFAARVPAYETTLSLLGAEVDACVAGCLYAAFVAGEYHPYVQNFAEETTRMRDLLLSGSGPSAVPLPTFAAPALPTGVTPVPPGVVNERLFALVAKIKVATNYTDTIGTDLGIIGPEATPGTGPVMPTFTTKVQAGTGNQQVALDFIKHRHTGVYIESSRHGGAWEALATDTNSPYIDNRALLTAGTPEVRQYRMRYWDKGAAIGDWSLVATVNVGP